MTSSRPSIPDSVDRDRALDPHDSYIVQAPAGSGKTTLLATRYVELLARVQRPEEILAVTFTKKAAAEMRHRVLALLQTDSPAAKQIRERNRIHAWHLFDNPNVLKIQTIDSFALEVASQTPNIDSAAGLSITPHAAVYYAQAANQLLGRLYTDDASNPLIAEFLAFLDNDAAKAERLLGFMLARRDQWLTPVTAVAGDRALDTTANLLAAAIDALREELSTQLASRLTADDASMLQRLADNIGCDHQWQSIFPVLLTKTGSLRKQLTAQNGLTDDTLKREAKLWLASLATRGLDNAIASYVKLPLEVDKNSAEGLQTLHLCCICLSLAAVELDALFSAAGLLDFTGVLIRAKQALRDDHGPTDLALYLDYRIKHMLVDEYQDTSRAQFEFFNLLTEGWQQGDGNTFFAVGDPMQSIYRFRDADVSIFADTRRSGLNTVNLSSCVLTANFRSQPDVVAWCNDLFERTFGKSSAAQLGEVSFSAAVPMIAAEPEANVQSLVFSEEAEETQHLLHHIKDLLAVDGTSNIAILCRARNHLSALLAALGEHGIAVQATDMDQLAGTPVIRDLLNLHAVLLDGSDRLAWFSLFRSPMFGLTLTELTQLSETTDIGAELSTLAIKAPQLGRLNEALEWAQSRLYEVPLREVLEGFWFRCGGVDSYPSSQWQHANTWFDLIDELKNDAYEQDILALALNSLFASSDLNARVQVMTIHKSKGLEFDHVIVPYLNRRAQSDEAQLLLWRASAEGLLMGVRGNDVHDWLTYEERERARNEEKRLLYVACTRAKTSLLTSYSCTEEKKPAGLAKLVSHTASSPVLTATQQVQLRQPEPQGELLNERLLKRIPRDYVWSAPAYPSLGTTSVVQPAQAEDHLSARFEVALGLLVHRGLAWLATPYGIAWRQSVHGDLNEDRNLQLRLTRWGQSLPVATEHHSELVAQCTEHLKSTLADKHGKWLLEPHEEAHSEWPLTGVLDGEVCRVILDRMFVADGHCWIIDFKTGQPHADETQTSYKAREAARYSPQLMKYRTIAGAIYNQPIKTALYFTGFGQLHTVT